ncbi:hypothetical protein JL720_4306 [Aureococcus anophagefferens]|nr:hypothetical protein JL720_4306 [Aureococcus anophagefferens]
MRTDNGTTVYHDLMLTPRPDDAERAALFECIHEAAPDLVRSIYEKRAPLRCLRAVAALEPDLAADHGLTALHLACAARDATAADVEEAMDACAATLDAVACRCPGPRAKPSPPSSVGGDTDTTQSVDEALLPEILHGLQGVALDHACAVDLLRDVVDSVNARRRSSSSSSTSSATRRSASSTPSRPTTRAPRRRPGGGSPCRPPSSPSSRRTRRSASPAFAAMRRLGAQRRYADDGFAYVKWLCFAWVGATFVVERRSRQLDVVAAWGALLLATRLLVDLRQLSMHLTRFIVALRMTLFDSAAFLLVLLIALVGFGRRSTSGRPAAPMGFAYEAGSAGDDGAPDDPYASPQG